MKKENNEFISYSEKHVKYYDLIDKDKKYDEECDFLDKVFKEHSKIEVKTILDLGCGTGNHAKILSEKGYSVSGIDISSDMVDVAKSKNIKNAEFFVQDMSNFNLNKKFDAIICMFASLGYLNKNEQIESALGCIKNHLRPGGLFIMHCWNGLGVLNLKPEARTREIDDGEIRVSRKSTSDLDSFNHVVYVNFDIEVKKKDGTEHFKEKHPVRFFFPQELKKYYSESGFEILEFCDGFKTGTKVDENVWWMSIISRLEKS